MAAEEAGWHEEAAKLCGVDEELMAVVGVDRSSSSIFNLDDINLDDIFLDLNDADMIPSFGADNHLPLHEGGLFSSAAGNLQLGSAPTAEIIDAPVTTVDAPAGGGVLSEGLQLCDDIDVTELEWLSNFCEESYSSDGLGCFIPCNAGGVPGAFHVPAGDDGDNKKNMGPNVVNIVSAAGMEAAAKDERNEFRTSSPISVLEHGGALAVGISPPTYFSTTTSSSTSSLSSPTSSSCSGIGGGVDHRKPKPSGLPEPGIVPARSRSKRPRPATFSPRPPIVIPLMPPSSADSSSTIGAAPLGSEEHDNFELVGQANQLENAESAGPVEKKKKKKPPPPAAADWEESAVTSSPVAVPVIRKCMHCEITKTPQWRAGPMGPKTLCNACGVRYKSGRLFPEYRPAASPTFESSLHSNSHKKVVEMRNKTIQESTPATPKPGNRRQDVAFKACELLEYIRRREWCTDNRISTSE